MSWFKKGSSGKSILVPASAPQTPYEPPESTNPNASGRELPPGWEVIITPESSVWAYNYTLNFEKRQIDYGWGDSDDEIFKKVQSKIKEYEKTQAHLGQGIRRFVNGEVFRD